MTSNIMAALWATQASYRALWMLLGGLLVWMAAEQAKATGRDVSKWLLICVALGVCTFGVGALVVLGWLLFAKPKDHAADGRGCC